MKASFVASAAVAILSTAEAFRPTGFSPRSTCRSSRSTKHWAYPDPQLLGRSPAFNYASPVASSDSGEVAIMPWNDVKQWEANARPTPASSGMSVTPKGSMVQATKTATPPALASTAPAGFKDIGIAEGQKFEVQVPPELANKKSTSTKATKGYQGGSENWFSHYPGDADTTGAMEPFCIPLVEGEQAH